MIVDSIRHAPLRRYHMLAPPQGREPEQSGVSNDGSGHSPQERSIRKSREGETKDATRHSPKWQGDDHTTTTTIWEGENQVLGPWYAQHPPR